MVASLSAQHIVKRYGGVVALADGNLEIHSGEVLALMGANGSGKSTLTKVITGVVAPNKGQLRLDDQLLVLSSPHAARDHGIVAVYQELSLVPDMTVAQNVWLGHEPRLFGPVIDWKAMHERTAALLDLFVGTFSGRLRTDAEVADLPPDERQIVEIIKALSWKPRLLILDEATASLDTRQVNRLFELIGKWKAEGLGIVFVSHRMEEIFRVGDRATVLRNGDTVGTVSIQDTNERQLVEMMIEGGAILADIPAAQPIAADVPTRLQVEGLRTTILKGLSFGIKDGELLGIGGLQGQGQTDLLFAIFGAIPFQGKLTLGNVPVKFRHPADAMRAQVALVPGERATEGLFMIRSILENMHITSWSRYGLPLRVGQARRDASEVAKDLRVVMASLDVPVSSLSGGNAQKVVIGKWLLRDPRLLLLNDPTKGIDVGAKKEFYALLDRLRESGTTIIFYSSDDDELIGLCDRVLVMHDGAIRAELTHEALTRENLVAASMGTA